MNILITDVKIKTAYSEKMSVGKFLISARFDDHGLSMQTLRNANVEEKVVLTDAIAKIRGLLENIFWIDHIDYFMKTANLKWEIQQLTGLVESGESQLQMIGLVEEASHLQEELTKLNRDEDRLTAEKIVTIALRTDISMMKTTTSPLVGSLQVEKAQLLRPKWTPK